MRLINVLTKEDPEHPCLFPMQGCSRSLQTGIATPSLDHAGTLILHFQPPKLEKEISVVYKLPSLWCFDIAARMD